jgi:anti-sigma28 factor (negative regulator of flagellin synthesis)
MRLQLDSTQLSSVDNRAAEAVSGNGQSSRAAYSRAGSGDTISLSGASNALNQFATHRAARIQQLTAAVQSGSYNVSSSALSSAIVRNGLA